MKLDEESVKRMLAMGDIAGTLRIVRSLQREVELKEELSQEYLATIARHERAFAALQDERDRLFRMCTRLEALCDEHGLSAEYLTIETEINEQTPKAVKPEVEAALEDLDQP